MELDDLLGPQRMPRVLRRFPRACGLGLLALGGWLVTDISRVADEGGAFLRALPVLTTVCLCLGAWLFLLGRPEDTAGYAPAWWNKGYAAALGVALVSALIIHAVWL
jgi:hypothetical protein